MDENKEKFVFLNQILQDSFLRMDALRLFYNDSNGSIKSRKLDVDKKYKYALELSDRFDALIESKEQPSELQFNDSLKNIKVDEKHSLSEFVIAHFEHSAEDELIQISYELLGDGDYNKYYDPVKALKEQKKCSMNEQILVSSVLSSSITIFENYLSALYRVVIMSNPQKYFGGKTIGFSELISDDLPKIISRTIDQEVEDKMYDSLETIKTIAKKENLAIEKYKNWMSEFEEIYFRRNIYIHNDGAVNDKYLGSVEEKYRKNIRTGMHLSCDEIYISRLFDVVSVIIVSLYYEIIRSIPNNETAIDWLGNQAFELLCNKNYQVAGHIYYLLSSIVELEFIDKLMYRINYINSEKQMGHKDIVNREISKLDVSATTEDFKIAKLCLEDKNDLIFEKLKETYPNSYDAKAIREWPIFIDFRKTEYYEIFANEHADDFKLHKYTEEKNTN